MKIDKAFAEQFAKHWVKAWNAHDLDAILSHYTEDFEMHSPLIAERMGVEDGKLTGKSAVGEYWAKGLAIKPPLHFELIHVFCGVGSLIIYYQGRKGLVAEIFHFNQHGKVYKASAHYQ
ncbi:nuclear transport factor 2 family protein [Saccharospirillum sp. HFRX-1]|uniref:nuclear transport factor 2 family protein n=1 Tax=unclassified Saccharospirillum TaxID=2633430 RepID=UPI003721C730